MAEDRRSQMFLSLLKISDWVGERDFVNVLAERETW